MVILSDIVIIFLLINIILAMILKARGEETDLIFGKYRKSLTKVYPGLSKEEIGTLLSEGWSRPYTYEPFTLFKEGPYHGQYVHVDRNGFRATKNQGPWPPAPGHFNVFLFGGSTAFNYGLPDDQTIASYLQDFLMNVEIGKPVCVYNFGRGHYYSSQEFVLFHRLLASGFIPDMAIFIDGLNEFYHNDDRPYFSKRIDKFISTENNASYRRLFFQMLYKLPVVRIAKKTPPRLKESEDTYQNGSVISRVIHTYVENKKLIEAVSGIYSVTPVFVWQPVPTYKYDLKYHLFAPASFGEHTYSKYGYPRMAEFVKKELPVKNFLWCADIQEGLQEPLYVDSVHYTAEMSKKLAQKIGHLLLERNLLVTSHLKKPGLL